MYVQVNHTIPCDGLSSENPIHCARCPSTLRRSVRNLHPMLASLVPYRPDSLGLMDVQSHVRLWWIYAGGRSI